MNKDFPILAIETTSDLCSVAIQFDEKNFVELNYLQKHIHSEKLMNMISYLCSEAKIDAKDFSSVAVSIGPGSFTGLRIGLSAAKGIAFGAGLPLIPVPTFKAHALQIADNLKDGEMFTLLSSASVEDFYFSKYQVHENSFKEIYSLQLIEKSSLEKELADNELIYGNAKITNKKIITSFPTAKSIANWAYLFGKDLLTFDYDILEPNYIKQFVGKVKK